jgi:hypothetical protein
MPNVANPTGLSPVQNIGTSTYDGVIRQYSVPSSDGTAIFVGDLVKLVGTSQIINGQVFADIAQAASGDVFLGVVAGFLADTRDSTLHRAASTQRIALVCDDPNALFEVAQGSGGTPLTANDVGLNVNVSVVAGSTVTGKSASVIDNTTEATTNTLDLKIMGMVNRVDNDPGTAVGTGAASSRFLVKINRHAFANQIAGV